MKKILLASFAFLFLIQVGWTEEPKVAVPPTASTQDSQNATYVLLSGDRVRITIYPEDKYVKGAEMQVSSDGNITLPLVGKVTVAGKTITQAESEIRTIIDADYLVNPEVVIEVLEYKEKSFVILGQVKKPGTYQFPAGVTHVSLLEAISMAGGFSDIANTKKIKIVRKTEGAGKHKIVPANAESIISGKEQDIDLQSGDVVHVSESLF